MSEEMDGLVKQLGEYLGADMNELAKQAYINAAKSYEKERDDARAALWNQDVLLAKAADILNMIPSEKAMSLGAEITQFRRQCQTQPPS